MSNPIQTASTLTCPECGHAIKLEMPTDACQFFYECEECKTVMRPLPLVTLSTAVFMLS